MELDLGRSELDLGRMEFNLEYSELDLRHSKLDSGHSKSNSACFDSLPERSKEGHLKQKMFLVTHLIWEITGRILSNCVKRMLDGKKEENSPKQT